MNFCKRQYKCAVRHLKRCIDSIQNNKFLAGVANSGCDIFEEIRKFRGKSSTYSSRIDDEVGSKNIATSILSCTIGLIMGLHLNRSMRGLLLVSMVDLRLYLTLPQWLG